jgi:hypothetical protein
MMSGEQNSKRKGLPIWLWVIIGIIVLTVISNLSSKDTSSTATTDSSSASSQQPSTPAPSPAPPPIKVSDEALTNEYVNNQFSADEKYKNQVLDVSGTVAAVDRDVMGNPYVSLSNSQFIEDTVFHFTNNATDTASLANISAGEQVTIQGTCKGKTGTEVDMENCSIIPNNQVSAQIQTNQQNTQETLQTSTVQESIPETQVSTASVVQAPLGQIVPSQGEINAELSGTVEVNNPPISFTSDETITSSDGNGGWITSVHGTRNPSADGYGQLIFFWHNEQFIGCDAAYESSHSNILYAKPGYIVVSYTHYAENDPISTPSLPDVNIAYTWNGTNFTSSGSPPTNIYGAEKLIYVKALS